MEVIRGYGNLGIRGRDFEVLFSHDRGVLTAYRYGGKEMLDAFPVPNFWRAPTQNDTANGMPARYGVWKLASLYRWYPGLAAIPEGRYFPEINETEHYVDVTYDVIVAASAEGRVCRIRYRVSGDGVVRVKMTMNAEGLPEMPEYGMLLRMDADYDHVEWYGLGPDETYAKPARCPLGEGNGRAGPGTSVPRRHGRGYDSRHDRRGTGRHELLRSAVFSA